jgi:hypothetical protein
MAKRSNTNAVEIITYLDGCNIRSLDGVQQHLVWRAFLAASSDNMTIKIGSVEFNESGKKNKNFGKAYANHNIATRTGNGNVISGNIQQYVPNCLDAEHQEKMLSMFNADTPTNTQTDNIASDQDAELQRLSKE